MSCNEEWIRGLTFCRTILNSFGFKLSIKPIEILDNFNQYEDGRMMNGDLAVFKINSLLPKSMHSSTNTHSGRYSSSHYKMISGYF